jgi:hypothetical protein
VLTTKQIVLANTPERSVARPGKRTANAYGPLTNRHCRLFNAQLVEDLADVVHHVGAPHRRRRRSDPYSGRPWNNTMAPSEVPEAGRTFRPPRGGDNA